MDDDPHDLDRFVRAQEAPYAQALRELTAGRKRSHWTWFVFPQLDGLGTSATARRFAIRSREEARAYLAHPVLGPRLLACAGAVLGHPDKTAAEIFGYPDDLKLRSSATLFAQVSPPNSAFHRLLARFYPDDGPDERTLALLGRG